MYVVDDIDFIVFVYDEMKAIIEDYTVKLWLNISINSVIFKRIKAAIVYVFALFLSYLVVWVY